MPDAVRIREARREDVAAIVALLADDPLGAAREVVSAPPAPAYLDAFDQIAADPTQLLAVALDDEGAIAGTFQMTVLPGLSNQGAALALVRAVRVAKDRRGHGLGHAMMSWALDEARRRGCQAIELFTHASRADAIRFYESLGFERSHAGMRRAL